MKILIIDDSALSRKLLKRALGPDHEIFEAADGMNGLEAYFLHQPEVVFLDLTMPGASGFDILAQLRQMDPGAQVVVGTADVQETSRSQVLALGALEMINKPFIAEAVQAVLKKIER